jgi:serine/threonine-protein kinase RsbW
MVDERRLVVSGRYNHIPLITSFVAEAARAAGFGDKGIFHCEMAADEACTNVIEHAYGGESDGEITVICRVDPGVCEIEVIDHGAPFDPDGVPMPAPGIRLEELKPGGIGLHLMRQMMDEVRFDFSADANRLTMVKRVSSYGDSPLGTGVQVEWPREDIAVIRPLGRLDSAAAPRFEAVLRQSLARNSVWLLVDLGAVTYISSRGLKALVTVWREARSARTDVVLAGMRGPVRDVFETVGFTQVFDVFETRDEALSQIASRIDG